MVIAVLDASPPSLSHLFPPPPFLCLLAGFSRVDASVSQDMEQAMLREYDLDRKPALDLLHGKVPLPSMMTFFV